MPQETFGLDIGSTSLKMIALTAKRAGIELFTHGITPNPIGKVIPDTPEERVRLVAAMQSLFRNPLLFSMRKVRIALPESMAYTRVIQVPLLTDSELSSAIRWEAEQHIPVPLSEVYLDYTVLSRPEKGVREGMMSVLLVGAKQSVVGKLVDVIETVKLVPEAMDSTLLCVERSLMSASDPPTIVVHSGANSTDFAVIADGTLMLTHTISTAGSALTRAVELELSLSSAQAEQYKRTYGLKPGVLDGKVRAVLIGLFHTMMTEAKNTMSEFESAHRGKKIQRVVLSGGTSMLPGISSDVAKSLGVEEVIIGNPFSGVSPRAGSALPSDPAIYSVAMGLAKRAK